MTTDFTHNPVLLDVRNLDVHYVSSAGQAPARALEDISFSLREGEMLGVVGESGCGKTTLMLSLMRLLPDAGRIVSGQIISMGRDLLDLSESEMEAVRWREISMIFQGAMNALNPVRTVGDQIAEAISWHNLATDKKMLDDRVCQLLELVGISTNRRNQYPHQFSGGMRQRAMIAIALACNPQVIIADEPTTALDVMIQAQILELLLDLRQKLGLAVLFVTHDLGVVAEVCDTVLVMYGGVVAEYAEVDTIFNEPQHPYTQRLLQAFPDLSDTAKDRRLASIPGYPPRLNNLPSGCRFAPRCPYVFERCHEAQPPLYRLGNTKRPHEVSCYLLESR
jgi:oligopeptide/dipeptide ABC transporter ATP-binding protein